MNGMNIYEGTPTGTVTNGIADIVISRVADHACRCDECVALDEVDLPMMALCKRYLAREITFEDFRLEHIQQAEGEQPSLLAAIHRNFDSGSVSLSEAVEGLMFGLDESNGEGEMTFMKKALGDREFRIGLHCLLQGYEIRMRTVHHWRVTNRPVVG